MDNWAPSGGEPDPSKGPERAISRDLRWAAALLLLLAALACSRDPAQPHITAADERLAAGDTEGAIEELEEAGRLYPGNPVVWNNLGNLYAQQGEFQRATELYKKAIEADPRRVEPHYNLANALVDMDRKEDALAEYEAALEVDPSQPEVHYNLAYTLYRLDRFADAWPHLVQARRLGADAEAVAQLDIAIRHYWTPPEERAAAASPQR